jgi:hypothetical protein
VLQTAASGVARFDHNPTTFESLGLLIEEQRTNLKTYSEELDNAGGWGGADTPTVTANAGVAPTGLLTADLLGDTSASVVQGLEGSIVITSGTGTYTVSCYIKRYTSNCCSVRVFTNGGTPVVAEIVIDPVNGAAQWRTGVTGTSFSITSVGNNWYRVSVTITDNATGATALAMLLRPAFAATYTPTISATATGSAFFWGAQLEAGAFPTSYIQTVASQVTRAADAASMTGANFSSWYNQAEGTFFSSVVLNQTPAQLNGFSIYAASDNTSLNRVIVNFGVGSGGNINSTITTGGTVQAQTINGSLSTAGAYSYANAYKVNDFASVVNGGSAVTDTSGVLPVINLLYLGANSAGTPNLNSTIRKLAYYPVRVTNAQLQGLTS